MRKGSLKNNLGRGPGFGVISVVAPVLRYTTAIWTGFFKQTFYELYSNYQFATASFTVWALSEEHPKDRFSPCSGLWSSVECSREPCSAMYLAHWAAELHISRSSVMGGASCIARNRLCSFRPFTSCWENAVGGRSVSPRLHQNVKRRI